MRVAVLDLGTNSTRLLVADVAGGAVRELERRSEVTRLGRGVELSGQLSAEAIEDVCSAVAGYVRAYEPLGVDEVTAIATSAVRDAANGEAFAAELRERFGLSPRLLRGEQEARLTYLGATAGRDGAASTLVCDIGGGSTELILGHGPRVALSRSLQVGVVRHTERHLKADPPTATELEALAGDVRARIAAALGGEPLSAAEGIAVAGTATSLAGIDLGADATASAPSPSPHGHRMGIEAIQRICSRLAAMPLAERRGVRGLHPDRAPTIVAGVVILIQAMRAFGLSEVEVSERDLLHGAALEAAGAA